MATQNTLPFPVLADTDGTAAKEWGVFDLLGDGVATPATFIINGDGEVAWQFVSSDANSRPSARDVLFALVASQNPF